MEACQGAKSHCGASEDLGLILLFNFSHKELKTSLLELQDTKEDAQGIGRLMPLLMQQHIMTWKVGTGEGRIWGSFPQ